MPWPRGSGRMQTFDEVDKAEWFDLAQAATKIVPGQRGFLHQLAEYLRGGEPAW
jgi:predicted NUDIX family NTP pyrophosphohydrolase